MEPGLPTQLAMAFALAAVTGIRASLPMLATCLLARYGYIPLNPGFAWMTSNQALVVLGAAVLIELLGDKFPVVDHLLDAAGLLIKPAAGTILGASLLTKMDPMTALILACAAGGATAAGVHVVKGKTRLASSFLTAGVANPFISVAEDILALAGAALAVLVPILAALAAVATAALAIWVVRRLRARVQAQAAPPPAPAAG